jgi:O-antigen ligase
MNAIDSALMTRWDASGRRQPGETLLTTTRSVLFVAVLLLCWVSVHPFLNLTDPALTQVRDAGDVFNELAYLVIGGGVAAYFLLCDPGSIRPLMRPVYGATVGWFVVTVITSGHPALSARRFGFSMFVMLLSAAIPVLPVSCKRFAGLLGGVTALIVATCFAGVALAPGHAIHQAYDVVDYGLAGDWRGLYPHKNAAGLMMVIYLFVGLYVFKAGSPVLGALITVGSAIFLAFTKAKTAIVLLPLILVLSWMGMRVRSVVMRGLILVGVLVGLNLFTVGSLYFSWVHSIETVFMPDPTFTGRASIWEFAMTKIADRPVLGHGFAAFWGTEETVGASSFKVEGGGPENQLQAHNGFLELVLTTGLPGLVLALVFTVVLPILDLQRCIEVRADPALTMLFLRMWLFGLYGCSTENLIFTTGPPEWFTTLASIFALRYLSIWNVVRQVDH